MQLKYMLKNPSIIKIIQEIIISFILLFTSFNITTSKKNSLFLLLVTITLIIIMFCKNKIKNDRYLPKFIIMVICVFVLIYGINYNNYYINNYLVSIVLFINIFILLKMCFPFKTTSDYITLLGIFLLLITFNFSKWKVKNMILEDVDYNWIYLKTIILTIMYLFSTCSPTGWGIKLLFPLYVPLLFPLNQYIIHRTLWLGTGMLYSYCYDNPLIS